MSAPARLAAKALQGLVDDAVFLGSRGGYCWFIGELLSAADETQLTVLAPEQRKGFVVELEVVRNAAHLFALLEDTLVGDPAGGLIAGPRADPKVAAVAQGEGEIEEGMFYSVGWHYEYWWGFRPEAAARATGLHPLVAAMIGVEATVDNLPEFRGRPVILMWPARFGSRQCDLNFFAPLHEALRSRVTVVRQLPPAEVDTLCDELRARRRSSAKSLVAKQLRRKSVFAREVRYSLGNSESPSRLDFIPRSHAASHACCSASSSREDDAPLPPGSEPSALPRSTNKPTVTSLLPDAATNTAPPPCCPPSSVCSSPRTIFSLP